MLIDLLALFFVCIALASGLYNLLRHPEFRSKNYPLIVVVTSLFAGGLLILNIGLLSRSGVRELVEAVPLALPPPPPPPPPVASEAEKDPRSIGVLYATNRFIERTYPGPISLQEITSKRSPSLSYGSVSVRVPEAHEIGRVERPSDYKIFGFTLFRVNEDEKLHFTTRGLRLLSKEEFIKTIEKSGNPGPMIFVHGFNTPFDEAIFKTAQLVYDMNLPGVPVTFSWPSKGGILEYDYDHDSAEFSRHAFIELLHTIQSDAKRTNIYVIAHSMGNQIVVPALAQAQEAGLGIAVSELVLAAPDVDIDIFRSNSGYLKKAAAGITLYASSADKAMLVSRIKAGGVPRAGDVPPDGPITAEGIDTIDVTAIGNDLFALNHSAFSNNRALIDDIGRLILTSTRPPHVRSPQLQRVPAASQQTRYWRYPQ